ncbi:MAG: hypothetical protein RL095_3289 [Verrucomicrobiota bacterium]|jgi:uncharacterized protein involved in response to NO
MNELDLSALGELPQKKRFAPPAFLAMGFRPFFFGGVLLAALALPLWTLVLHGGWGASLMPPQPGWHAREMLYGFGLAIDAGFLLTAIVNWTGRTTTTPLGLAGLFCLWLLTRALSFGGASPQLIAIAHGLFVAALAFTCARPLWQSAGQRRNLLIFIPILSLLGLGGVMSLLAEDPHPWLLAGLDLHLLLILVMAGRVVPSFTAVMIPGWTPQRFPRLEKAVAASFVLGVLLQMAGLPLPAAVAFVFSGCCLPVLLRGLWHRDVLGIPMLWVLHIGLALMVPGLLLRAAALCGWLPLDAAVHCLATGTMSVVILGMIWRVTLGHGGRPIQAGRPGKTAFVLIIAAALLRTAAPFLPELSRWLHSVAGVAASVALLIYLGVHGRSLFQARADGKPG